MQNHKRFREEFQRVLEPALEAEFMRWQSLGMDESIQVFLRHALELIRVGGKRVRPYVLELAYLGAGGTDLRAIRSVEVGLEVFHSFALMHDDIIDKGESRHGVTTLHEFIGQHLRAEKRNGDAKDIGISQTILVGDLLLAWANRLITSGVDFPSTATPARVIYAEMIEELVLGQMLDVDFMTRERTSMALLERRMLLKTAGYTFVHPLRLGAALAGASEDALQAYRVFGEAIGLAFQLQDDLFDLTLTSEQSGKTPFCDLRDGQSTIFTEYIFDHGTAEQRARLKSWMRTPLTESQREEILALFTESGALPFGKARMQGYFENAKQALQQLPCSPQSKEAYQELVNYIETRQA